MARRAFFAFCLFIAGALQQYFWEFIRTALYDRGLQMLAPQIEGISVDTIVHYGLTAVLFGCGAFLVWPSRSAVLRWGSPLRLFLDRDPKSEQVGIQTSSGVTYIQISVATSKPIRALTKSKGEWPGSLYIHHEPGGLAEVARALGALALFRANEPGSRR